MGSPLFLITGATGATGGNVIALLRERGHRVRAFVHQHDECSAQLQRQGVEIAVGDLLDFTTIRPALDGVSGAYFVYPIAPGLIEAAAYFAQAAKEAAVSTVVNMSQTAARREAKSHAAFNHWVAERVFDWSGLAVTHLRPTFFSEVFLYSSLGFKDGIKDGLVRLPFGDEGKHAPVAAEDQARVVATILEDPAAHRGKTYRLFGPEEYTFPRAVAKISEMLGREVKYEQIPLEVYHEQMVKALGPFFAQHIVEMAKDHAAGVLSGTDEVIESITGQPPMGLEEFIRKHRQAFQLAAHWTLGPPHAANGSGPIGCSQTDRLLAWGRGVVPDRAAAPGSDASGQDMAASLPRIDERTKRWACAFWTWRPAAPANMSAGISAGGSRVPGARCTIDHGQRTYEQGPEKGTPDMSAIDTLMQRNAAFAERRFTPNLPLVTTLGITVIGCVDPRVDPAHVLGLELGEAAVLRNISGRVTPAALQMLTLLGTLPRLLDSPSRTGGMHLVVLQHTDCGITRLAREPDRLAPYFGVAPDELDAKAVQNPYAAVQVDVAALQQAVSALPEGSTVTGLVYDVATGRVEIVAPTTPLSTPVGDTGRAAGETAVPPAGADTPSRDNE